MIAALALLYVAAAPAGTSVLEPQAKYELAIYWLSPPPAIAELRKLVSDEAISLVPADMKQYAPPSPDMLSYFGRGLTVVQINEVQKAVAATRFVVTVPAARRFEVYERVIRSVGAAAMKFKGYPWDEATRELFTVAEFKKRRMDTWKDGKPVIASHIVGHFYEEDATGHRLVTLGMQKLALPDLAVDGATPAFGKQLQELVNLTANQLMLSPQLGASGEVKVGSVTVTLKKSPPKDGDAPNTLYAFDFPGTGARTARIAALLKAAFGFTDQPTLAHESDAELNAARDRARARLPDVKKRFPKLKASLQSLHVKAPFGSEWMWVEVQRWEGDSLTGVLLNDPYEEANANLKRGAIVTAKQGELFDYIVNLPDGGTEGGETNEIIKKMRQ